MLLSSWDPVSATPSLELSACETLTRVPSASLPLPLPSSHPPSLLQCLHSESEVGPPGVAAGRSLMCAFVCAHIILPADSLCGE